MNITYQKGGNEYMLLKFIAINACAILFSMINTSWFRIGACSAWMDMSKSLDVKHQTFEDSRTKERIKAYIAEIIISVFIFYLISKGD